MVHPVPRVDRWEPFIAIVVAILVVCGLAAAALMRSWPRAPDSRTASPLTVTAPPSPRPPDARDR